ncbi:MAG: PIN domain-containing protein [Thermomicrobiales bacterium]
MRVLLDTDVILDFFLAREPFVVNATALLEATQRGDFDGYISASTPINVFYHARKFKGIAVARHVVTVLLASLPVCLIDGAIVQAALVLSFSDYEDAVQHASATASGMEAIVTRNRDDYRRATLPVFSPADFLAQLPH